MLSVHAEKLVDPISLLRRRWADAVHELSRECAQRRGDVCMSTPEAIMGGFMWYQEVDVVNRSAMAFALLSYVRPARVPAELPGVRPRCNWRAWRSWAGR